MHRRLFALLVVALIVAPLVAFAAAQDAWAVQTVALRDFREAEGVVADLRSLGYDAYSEFAMHDGKQYSRVRVGCFLTRALADDMAAELQGSVTAEAVVVPFTLGARALACVAGDVGFELPQQWGVLENGVSGVVFWVELAGRRGFLAYDGLRWRVAQNEEEAGRLLAGAGQGSVAGLPAQSPGRGRETSFTTGSAGAVEAVLDGRHFVVAFGELLWRSARTAVVRTGDRITAVGLLPPLQ